MASIPCVLEVEGEEEDGVFFPGELLTGGRDRPGLSNGKTEY